MAALIQCTMLAQVALEQDHTADYPPDWVGLIDSFLETDIAETTTLLHVIAALTADDLQRARIRTELRGRRQPVASQVRLLPEARITAAWQMVSELADGDNIILGIAWPDGMQACAIVYIDHLMGTVVKDAFFVAGTPEAILGRFAEIAMADGHPDIVPAPLDPGAARARVEEAIARFEQRHPEWTQDAWPACRALLEYLLRTVPLPAGPVPGTAASMESVEQLLADFLASPEARRIPPGLPVEQAARELLDYTAELYLDPLWWSVTSVRDALTDELPFWEGFSEATLSAVPDLLPELVCWSHRVRGISRATNERTLGVVRTLLPVFEQLCQEDDEDEDGWEEGGWDDEDEGSWGDLMSRGIATGDPGPLYRRLLLIALGSQDAVEGLHARPLPEEPLDLAVVPADLRARVAIIGAYLDEFVETADPAHFGVEFRTACRRFLTRVAVSDPEVLRRRAKDRNTAAAIAWLIGRTNDLVGHSPRPMTGQALAASFGLSAPPADRAQTLAVAFNPGFVVASSLASPDVLVSRARARLVEWRDRWW